MAEDKRKQLYKQLYMTSMSTSGTTDREYIRERRDMAIKEVTTITRGDRWTVEYKNCTIAELIAAKNYLEKGRAALFGLKRIDEPGRNKYATQPQIKKMHYLLLGCAIHYAPTLPTKFGEIVLEGDALRNRRYQDFESGNGLSSSCKHTCYRWAVPKVHRLLAEKGLRTYNNQDWESKIHIQWSDIKREEADEIIRYFSQMYNQIQERYRPVSNNNYSLN